MAKDKKLFNGTYLVGHETPRGLVITATREGREEAREAVGTSEAHSKFYDLFEDWIGNGWTWIPPEDIGALTDAPIISPDATIDDEGQVKLHGSDARVYWHERYAIEDPIAEWAEGRSVTFDKARSENPAPGRTNMAKTKTKKRKRNRKTNPENNHSTLGAFIGSVVGGIPGHIITAAGAKGLGAVVTELGWIGGGAAGGYYGATDDRKRRAAIGGAVGGVFTPIGAAVGGWVGGLKPDKRRNPAPWVIPVVAAGTLALGTTGVVLYLRRKKKKDAPGRLDGDEKTPGKHLTPLRPPRPDTGTEMPDWPPYVEPIAMADRDDWGYPAQDTRYEEGVSPEGVPYRIYQSVTEGMFYGAWQSKPGEPDENTGAVNFPYGDDKPDPWGIAQAREAILSGIQVPFPV